MWQAILIEVTLTCLKRLVKYADNKLEETHVSDVQKHLGKQMATLNFSDNELRCKCGCGRLNTTPAFNEFMEKVQALRTAYGKPLVLSSAYRCPEHPIEAAKTKAGQHSKGAVDIRVAYAAAHEVLRLAFSMGFTGIGVNQKGSHRYIHLDMRPNPTVWSYQAT